MSSKTNYLDAQFNKANFRTEFRLPRDMAIKSNMRICGLGMISSTTASQYVLLTGAYGIIESIQLYDGSTLLDQVQSFSQYTALKNVLRGNQDNMGVANFLARSQLGYYGDGDLTFAANGSENAPNVITNQMENTSEIAVAADTEATRQQKQAWLSLSDCLGFLRESLIVPTNVFKNLRVVINYKSAADLKNMAIDPSKAYSTEEPFMVYENIVGDLAGEMMRDFKGVQFDAIEHDSVLLPAEASATQVTVTKNFLVNGFNNKHLKKLVILNTETTPRTESGTEQFSFSNQGSASPLNYGVQVRINGANLFSGNELQGKNKRLGVMTDAWGALNMATGQNLCKAFGVANTQLMADTSAGGYQITNTIGQLDYTGFDVNAEIKELRLSLSRDIIDGAANTSLNSQYRVNMFGVVRKAVVPSGGGYLVVYV